MVELRSKIGSLTNKNMLYCRGNSIQYSVMAYMGKESKTKQSGDRYLYIDIYIDRYIDIYREI